MAADDKERKVALLLEHGVRADRSAAQKFVADARSQHFDEADYQHRIELMRMYDCHLDTIAVELFRDGFKTILLPLLAFLDNHKCGS